ncbi:unnamed protein product [Rhizopus stolonifer]
MGCSSIITLLLSIIVYWYKKDQRKALGIKKTSIHDIQKAPLTPPLSPVHASPPLSQTSPRGKWSTKLIDGVMSATGMKRKMTISLKNTVLWNPSRDVSVPNHAFHENSIQLLYRLSQSYDIYVMVHINTEEDQRQIKELLTNANVFKFIDSKKVFYCSSSIEKLQMIHRIEPSIHIEGGWEQDDGNEIVDNMKNSRVIWILPNQKKRTHYGQYYEDVEIADRIVNTSIVRM